MNKNYNEKIISYLKTYGFIIVNSEIYGGLNNSWDYGHLGVMLKNNIQNLWWKYFVLLDKNVYEMDSSIISNPKVWEASGHLENFADLLVDCKNCKKRFRVDHFLSNYNYSNIENKNEKEIDEIIQNNKNIKCLKCGENNFTNSRKFNLMYKVFQNTNEDESYLFLRPETAQSIFVNFKNFQRTMRLKLPFAIAQIGKSFRNEITIGNSIFRTREFEQMEIEWFCNPEDADSIFLNQIEKIKRFLIDYIELEESKLFFTEISKEDLAHYSSRTIDIEYEFAHGRAELWGIANRTDFDLSVHEKYSNQKLSYFDEKNKSHFLPYVIEPSVGLNRLMYAVICNSYLEEIISDNNQESRILLKIPYILSPYKVCVLSLTKVQNEIANLLHDDLLISGISANSDYSGSIGKRYRRSDAIGTPYCITCDYLTFDDQINDIKKMDLDNIVVTLRNRDTMKQIQIKYYLLKKILISKLDFNKNKILDFDWN